MSQQYASKQPQGYKNHLEKVAIVGGGGRVGSNIVDALLKAGKLKVTALTREDSTNKMPEGVEVKNINYDDQASIVSALQGQDALIITMSVMAPPEQQTKLIDAAAAAGVKWILPNEYGFDPLEKKLNEEVSQHSKAKFREQIEKLGSSYINVACSFWYEYSLSFNSVTYGFDLNDKTLTFFDDGNTRINTTTLPQTGRAVANLLALKVLPEDVNDKSPCLDNFRNKTVYVASFNVSQKDMLDSVLRVTGTSLSDWKVNHESTHDRYKVGQQELQGGNRMGFVKMMYSRAFYPEDPSRFEEKRGLHNDVLGLPKENIDDYTKLAVEMAAKHKQN